MDRPRRQLSLEELVEVWDGDRDGEYIQVNQETQEVHSIAHQKSMGQICPPNQWSQQWLFRKIREWMDHEGFWPNIWGVNERGNVTLYDKRGRDLGGIV